MISDRGDAATCETYTVSADVTPSEASFLQQAFGSRVQRDLAKALQPCQGT